MDVNTQQNRFSKGGEQYILSEWVEDYSSQLFLGKLDSTQQLDSVSSEAMSLSWDSLVWKQSRNNNKVIFITI